MKILWLGDAGCHTGFSRVTHSIGERLARDFGHEVHVLAYNYQGDSWPSHLDPERQTSLRLYMPHANITTDIYGQHRHVELLGRIEPDVVVMLNDAHMILSLLLENRFDPQKILLQYRPILSYVPVDGVNLPPAWTELVPKVTHPVAMSKWGRQALGPSTPVVYHGFDPEQFWPVKERPIRLSSGQVVKTKKEIRRALGVPDDAFFVLRVDSNSGRKDFASSWRSLVPFMKRHPDVHVWFHCDPGKTEGHGTRMDQLVSRSKAEGIDPKRFWYPDFTNGATSWPQEDLNALYNMADAFITNSRGEGFGFTPLEAIGCGIPVIAQNVSAIPEVVGPGGILLDPLTTLTVPSGEDVWLSDTTAFTSALEELYASKGMRRDLGEAGRAHALSFSWDYAATRFDELLSDLHRRAAAEAEASAPEA